MDYIRANLFRADQMVPLPFDVPGPDNDLNEKIDYHVQRALAEEDAMICAFGERWGPEFNRRDKYFGFKPGNGIHDIHMNQGSAEEFKKYNGVWQDGAILIHLPSPAPTPAPPHWHNYHIVVHNMYDNIVTVQGVNAQ